MPCREMTRAEVVAIETFARENGPRWKWALRDAWMRACTNVSSHAGVLQRLRNDPDFGPAGLNAYQLQRAKLTAAQRIRVRELMEDEGNTRAEAVAWVLAFEPTAEAAS